MLAIAFIIIVIVMGYYFLHIKLQSKKIDNVVSVKETEVINRFPFDFKDFFKGDNKTALLSVKTSYGKLSFELLTDWEHSGTLNRSYSVTLNNQKMGEIGGEGFGMNAFSLDKRYYSIRSRGSVGCASMCQDTSIYVLDLKDKKVFDVQYPMNGYDFPKSLSKAANSKFIESYSWKENNIINLTTFLVSIDTKSTNRISPKQIWEYNIATKQYTLIQTLSE